ncbi:MAG TPA: DctP family TRAP transporter solute-binding subunit [Candidatus Atribacteria bacterium]|nr:DctP family TRAP transporter solute-binding subunit [Candidatus Atribacteria bacterium]
MKKINSLIRYFALLFIIFLLLQLGASAVNAESEYVLKIAHSSAIDVYKAHQHAIAMTFKQLVESRSGDRIEVRVFGAGAVGGEREYVEAIMTGTMEAGLASGVVGSFFPSAMITDIPYLFPDVQVAYRVLDGPFGDKLSQLLLEQTGLKNMGFSEIGYRNFTNSVRPIHTPEDMKGLKIRVQESPLFLTMVEALGANPTPIAWTETYTALQSGIVDGQENPVGTIIFANFAEVQDYLTLDGHVYGVNWFLINNDFFERLPSDLQKIVQDAALIANLVGRGVSQLNAAMGINTLKEAGMEVYALSPDEKDLFKKATQGPVIEWLKTKINIDLINEALEAVDKVVEEN